MIDFGYPLRQKYIAESATLDAKRAALRERLHKENCYLLGEEILARRNGGKVFDRFTGWRGK